MTKRYLFLLAILATVAVRSADSDRITYKALHPPPPRDLESLAQTTPAFLPAPPLPKITNARERTAWEIVMKYTARYGIPEQAPAMFRTIYCESRCFPEVVSPTGRYVGICQFLMGTFDNVVNEMKRAGEVPAEAGYSPFKPDQAIQVMAWMWSRGLQTHWPVSRNFITPVQRRQWLAQAAALKKHARSSAQVASRPPGTSGPGGPRRANG